MVVVIGIRGGNRCPPGGSRPMPVEENKREEKKVEYSKKKKGKRKDKENVKT
jgi:hypothetical protein